MDFKLDPPECFCESHAQECGCAHCHTHQAHDWKQWTIYPSCVYCENEMIEEWSDEIQRVA